MQTLLDNLFKLSTYHAAAKTKLIADIATFFTMVDIVFVNPSILGVTGMDT